MQISIFRVSNVFQIEGAVVAFMDELEHDAPAAPASPGTQAPHRYAGHDALAQERKPPDAAAGHRFTTRQKHPA